MFENMIYIFMEIKKCVRELRRNQTESEKIFWANVRNRKFLGKKFLRQHPIKFEYQGEKRFFVADFYCAEAKLIIELDGKIHDHQKERDQYRTYLLKTLGYRIIRFPNETIEKSLAKVFKTLETFFFSGSMEEKEKVAKR